MLDRHYSLQGSTSHCYTDKNSKAHAFSMLDPKGTDPAHGEYILPSTYRQAA